MKQIETKARRKGRSPGRKEKRRRTARALAAAGAIAGGTQAYAVPFRFDNPPHGEAGHFHWVGEIGEVSWLDVKAPPEDQVRWLSSGGKAGHRLSAVYGSYVGARRSVMAAGPERPENLQTLGVPLV